MLPVLVTVQQFSFGRRKMSVDRLEFRVYAVFAAGRLKAELQTCQNENCW
jgi:hypothetical protein